MSDIVIVWAGGVIVSGLLDGDLLLRNDEHGGFYSFCDSICIAILG